MKIAINAHLVSFSGNYRQAGVSKYTEQLINSLLKLETDHQFTIYYGSGKHPASFGQADNSRLHTSALPTEKPVVRIGWEQIIAPFALLRDRPDVLHCPVNVMPLAATCPVVITIHDLGFMRYPERYKAAKRRYLHTLTSLSARRAAHIITPSEFGRQEVIELLKISPDKVTAVAEGFTPNFRPLPADVVAEWSTRQGLPSRFVLYVGTLEPRKNLPLLLRAFQRWQANTDRAGKQVKLVLGGGKGWLYQEIYELIGTLNLGGQVELPGYIPEEDLPLWYNSAECLVYPSVYEGFGLPPLEAMACGCPVITSFSSSLPEVVGDAGIMVAPTDEVGLAAALKTLLENPAERQRYASLGVQQAARFSWQRAALETLDVYKRVANK